MCLVCSWNDSPVVCSSQIKQIIEPLWIWISKCDRHRYIRARTIARMYDRSSCDGGTSLPLACNMCIVSLCIPLKLYTKHLNIQLLYFCHLSLLYQFQTVIRTFICRWWWPATHRMWQLIYGACLVLYWMHSIHGCGLLWFNYNWYLWFSLHVGRS